MILSVITAPLTAALGYLYPAYMTYKAVEKRQPNVDELQFWGKYWIVLGALFAMESLTLGVLFVVPFYTVIRLVFMIYLWHPRTQGVLLVYHKVVQPVVMTHEERVDKTLHELHTRGADLAVEAMRNVTSKFTSVVKKNIPSAQKVQ